MEVTDKFLKDHNACREAIEWFNNQPEKDSTKLIKLAIKKKEKLDWANFLIVRVMKTKKQRVQYAIFAAELVIKNYEKKYQKDDRPRKAIGDAKKYLKNPTAKNRSAAKAAAGAAAEAARAAGVAGVAAEAAEAARAAGAAAWAAGAAGAALIKILKYGLKISHE